MMVDMDVVQQKKKKNQRVEKKKAKMGVSRILLQIVLIVRHVKIMPLYMCR